jgi:hypothetical protein
MKRTLLIDHGSRCDEANERRGTSVTPAFGSHELLADVVLEPAGVR